MMKTVKPLKIMLQKELSEVRSNKYIFYLGFTHLAHATWIFDNACGHRRRRHWMSRLRDCPLSAAERFPSPRHEHRTVCQPKWRHQIPCKPSKPN